MFKLRTIAKHNSNKQQRTVNFFWGRRRGRGGVFVGGDVPFTAPHRDDLLTDHNMEKHKRNHQTQCKYFGEKKNEHTHTHIGNHKIKSTTTTTTKTTTTKKTTTITTEIKYKRIYNEFNNYL